MPASETLLRVMPLLQRFGITRIARHTGLDHIGVPVWCAYAPNARSAVIAQGKGLSDEDAKVSAVMEALERAVASRPAVPSFDATARQLQERGHRLATLDGLIGLRKADIGLDNIVEWATARELLSGTPIHIPLEAAVLDRRHDSRFWVSSDGLASGNSLDEAVLHGTLERIERDAFVLWQIGDSDHRHATCVDPTAFGDEVLNGLVRKVETAGLVLKVFDIGSDIAVPCFTALLGPKSVLSGAEVRFTEVTGGSGAHPSPVRAIIRAVTEAVQSRLTFISGARDDISPDMFLAALPDQLRRSFLAAPVKTPVSAPLIGLSLQQCLAFTLDALRDAGITTVAALTLGEPDLPFSVVKVFVPELENPEGRRKRRFGSRALSKAFLS
ncbi:YcaO-like family protein [Rhizobium sp. 2MFCol3.1]|uniref:YcaO-like family protein n=1 Tax=Rhizobium sp. 2MFCol3.1 TaxID=1246459 RepID=UPI000475F2CA|nr:YcaO-like family protein [Rhizobium sp. 2MFCol3.1]